MTRCGYDILNAGEELLLSKSLNIPELKLEITLGDYKAMASVLNNCVVISPHGSENEPEEIDLDKHRLKREIYG